MQRALDRLAAKPAPLPVRRTERLLLRPWQEADREPFAAMNADLEVMAHMPAPLTRAESDALIDRWRLHTARRGFGEFAVQARESGELIGAIGLTVPSWDADFMPAVEIGWRIARKFWSQGLATEAARDVLSWAFGTLQLPQVVSFTVPANERSWRVMERLGMRRVGGFEHPGLPVGDPLRPHVLYVIDGPKVAADPPVVVSAPMPPKPTLPRVWIDGDGAPRVIKEILWNAARRGAIEVWIVANRPLVVPRHPAIRTIVVNHGMDVADDWLVAHAGPGELVVTADVPLAAELVPRGVAVVSPRGEWFTPANIGEKLSLRDFFTDARASGMIEGGGPGGFDERAKRDFANGLDRWITSKRGAAHGG